MASLIIGMVVGFLYSILAQGTMEEVAETVKTKDMNHGLIASAAFSLVQILWALIATGLIAFTHYHLIAGKKVQSVASFDKTIVLLSAFILVFLLVRYIKRTRSLESSKPKSENYFLKVFLLSITKPIRIVGFLALFMVLGAHRVGDNIYDDSFLVIGTAIGSYLWWYVFCSIVDSHKDKADNTLFAKFHRGAALALLAGAIISAFITLM